MPCFARQIALVGSAAAALAFGIVNLGLALGPLPPALLAAGLVAVAFGGLFLLFRPEIKRYEDMIASQQRYMLAQQQRIGTVEAHMQHQIGAHLKTAEAEKRKASELCAAKARYLVHMSQAIRTPLTGIVGSLELMGGTALTDQQMRLRATMERSASMLLDIVNDVLDLASAAGGKLKLASTPFDLARCVESAAEIFETEARDKGLAFNVFVSNDIPALLVGDESRLRQILMNLVGNAVKYTAKGTVEVSAMLRSRQDDAVRLRFVVRDSGQGMPPAVQKQVFLPPDQRDPTITASASGAGLGLSIVYQLVQLMRGQIKLESAPQKGTVVECELPFAVAESAADPGGLASSEYKGLRVLVVSESEAERQVVGSYLNAAGAAVEAAAGAWEGIDLLRQAEAAGTPFNLVIADCALPCDWEGDFAGSMRSEFPVTSTALVVTVENEGKLDELMAVADGRWEYVTKPLRRKELFDAVERQLGLVAREPAPEAADAGSDTADDERAARPPLKLHVLVAEDNLINQEVLREHLSEFGCTFKVADNGEQAVQAFSKTQYDVILMDCQMPVMDGLSATAEIRALEQRHGLKRTPIVAVSAHAFERERVKCLGAQMDDFLSKPYTEDQLYNIVEKAVRGARRSQAA